jgi:hypothetical protein
VRDVLILTPSIYLDTPVADAVRQWEFETALVGARTSLSLVPLKFSFSASPPQPPTPAPSPQP